VKQEVKLVSNLIQVQNLRRERGLAVLEQSRHLIFTGNPGTGKTTVARLLAQLYRTLGVVAKGHLVETDRAGLVAGYVGQTATKVTAVFDQADEGVLLIDEAYALVRGGAEDFGKEAIDTIVKLVEDRRERIVVIAAGYTDEMQLFVDANPGLRSRFPRTIEFPDYDTDELLQIFRSICDKAHYLADAEAVAAVRRWIDAQPRVKGFGNGRLVRNLFEASVARQAGRVVAIESPTDAELVALTAADIPAVGEGPGSQPSAGGAS
jgi:SpoVK/Ycf46/Vps4 family AAA+-type ATPase